VIENVVLIFCTGHFHIMRPVLSIVLSMLWRTFVNCPSLSGSLSTVWLLVTVSLISVVHGGEYMTVSRSSAVVNVTYHSRQTDSINSEVRHLPNYCGIFLSFTDRKLLHRLSMLISLT